MIARQIRGGSAGGMSSKMLLLVSNAAVAADEFGVCPTVLLKVNRTNNVGNVLVG